MAWSTPLTAIANTALTAAQWNATVRDDLLETAPAKATSSTAAFYAGNGTNSIVQRLVTTGSAAGPDGTTSTTYTSLASTGPDLSCTTGTRALVWINAQQENTNANVGTWTSYAVSGATTTAAQDEWAILTNTAAAQSVRAGVCKLETVTAGTNSFNMRYKVTANTGSWQRRLIQVMPF
jgi:hypothetical protein